MKSRTAVNHWLHTLSAELQLDADGLCLFQRDGHTAFMIELAENSKVCHLCAVVVPLSAELLPELSQKALTLNQLGRPLSGCWLALDRDNMVLTLCYNLLVDKTNATAFGETVQNFLIALDAAREQLALVTSLDEMEEAFFFDALEKNDLIKQVQFI